MTPGKEPKAGLLMKVTAVTVTVRAEESNILGMVVPYDYCQIWQR